MAVCRLAILNSALPVVTMSANFQRLVEIMARLRGPDGCPWDREQTLETLRAYAVEETYEVLDAIERKDWGHLAEELGDLQLQIVFQSQIASEDGKFTIDDVLGSINEKLIRRHPHVFGDESANTSGEVLNRWEQIKAEEKQLKGANGTPANESILQEISRSQPAMLEARQIGKTAAKTGFDWRQFDDLIAKLEEEIAEVQQARALQSADRADRMEEEVGDLLFMVVNIARHLKVNPEMALRRANAKFRERFGYIERRLHEQGKAMESADLEEMEELWQQAKKH